VGNEVSSKGGSGLNKRFSRYKRWFNNLQEEV